MHDWIHLTNNLGETIVEPSEKLLATALKELFENRDDEHPDAWLSCGSDGGPLHTISIFSGGYAIYTKYSDADMTDELAEIEIPDIDQTSGLALWKALIAGKVPSE